MVTPQMSNMNMSKLQSMAIDAYVYGYPLVIMDLTENNMLSSGHGINQFYRLRSFPTPQFNTVVAPNVDTLYSSAWLDLSKEPFVLHVPDTQNTYYVLEMLDAWTNVISSIGPRTTGTIEEEFSIIGPEWKGDLPEGITKINVPTNTVWIICRIQTNGPNDIPFVNSIQNKFTLTPLSYWKQSSVPRIRDIKNKHVSIESNQLSTKEQVNTMDGATFFKTMVTSMYNDPPYSSIEDPNMNKNLSLLGLTPSKKFDFLSLSSSIQDVLEYAAANGPKFIETDGAKTFRNNSFNGWSIFVRNIGNYGRHFQKRAIVAMFVLGANLPQDAVYGIDYVDNHGKPLVGINKYIIHFNKNRIPPANAFWSITLYDPQGFLVENSINCYAISSHIGKLIYNTNGSLDIYIQNTSPGGGKESNWLPSPKGSFNLMLRMYWPKQKVLNGEYKSPAVMRN